MRSKVTALIALALALFCASGAPLPSDYFGIQIVDSQTGRGVPMVELKTTSHLSYYTDSGGWVAFYEPGLMNRTVWFEVSSQGYEFPADGFGQRGVRLDVRPGKTVKLKIKRLNIAERLYRITGEGIYRDTVLLGLKPPIAEPLLNAEITGQDGVLNAIYRGKLYWFYGDTLRASYALGNYHMTGATSVLPDKIDPSVGFDLRYFIGDDGFARPMAPLPGEGLVWLTGVVVLPGPDGWDQMLAFYWRRQGMGEVYENGFVEYNEDKEQFDKLKAEPLNSVCYPKGYPFTAKGGDGVEYIYFTAPYPNMRVKADRASYLDLSSYEGYTCLKPGLRRADKQPVERDAAGRPVWGWKKNTPPLTWEEEQSLIKIGALQPGESPFRLRDAATGKPIRLNGSSCSWNDYRKRYVMIASQSWGATMLGEVWYSEADRPEGPWTAARKIITHANKPHDAHDFYNPVHHPFFDRDGGRIIYLEGSYADTFSGSHSDTPLYEYNQIMYRLDLADPRLRLP